MLKRIFMLLALLSLTGCEPPPSIEQSVAVQARIQTSEGDIVVELDRAHAPITVANFLAYVQDKAYDGTIFHRVIDGFMIQGGGFDENFQLRPARLAIKNEANNGLKNTRGTIAMARTGDPHSATSQFFINAVDNPNLDYQSPTPRGWGYAVFGKVVSGMEIVDKIRALPTGPAGPFLGDVPLKPVIIYHITLETGHES